MRKRWDKFDECALIEYEVVKDRRWADEAESYQMKLSDALTIRPPATSFRMISHGQRMEVADRSGIFLVMWEMSLAVSKR